MTKSISEVSSGTVEGNREVLDVSKYGMASVSRDRFFAVVGPMNVHPSNSHSGKWDDLRGYESRWQTPFGDLVGITVGGTHLSEPAYLLAHRFIGTVEGQ